MVHASDIDALTLYKKEFPEFIRRFYVRLLDDIAEQTG